MRRINALLGLFALLLGGMAITATAASAGGGSGGHTHVFVCKYVGQHGVGEVLKDGKRPIYVSSNATVGTWFNDAQGRSYVLAIADTMNTGKGKTYTGDLTCPVPGNPTVVTPVEPSVLPPTCEHDGQLALGMGMNLVGYHYDAVKTSGPADRQYGTYTVTAVADTGYVLKPGVTSSWVQTVLPQLTGEQCTPLTIITPVEPNVLPPTCTTDGQLGLGMGMNLVGYHYDVVKTSGDPGRQAGTYTVTAVADAGYAFPVGATTSWTQTVLPQLTGEQCGVCGHATRHRHH